MTHSENENNPKMNVYYKNKPNLTLNPNVGGSNPSGPAFVFCLFCKLKLRLRSYSVWQTSSVWRRSLVLSTKKLHHHTYITENLFYNNE